MDGFSALPTRSSSTSCLSCLTSGIASEDVEQPPRHAGFVDFHGHHGTSGHWLFCGWIDQPWSQPTVTIRAVFDNGSLEAEGRCAFYTRTDLDGGGIGIVLLVAAGTFPAGSFASLLVCSEHTPVILLPADDRPPLSEPELRLLANRTFATTIWTRESEEIRRAINQTPYNGHQTITELSSVIRVGLDYRYRIDATRFILTGWLFSTEDAIASLRVRSGAASAPLNLAEAIRLDRPDVTAAFQQYARLTIRCGFIALVGNLPQAEAPLYLEIQTVNGETGYAPLPDETLTDLAAATQLLSLPTFNRDDIRSSFERVLAPALKCFTNQHRSMHRSIATVQFGTQQADAIATLIIPLYGRVDFLEYQLALIDAQDRDVAQIIYILDQPDRQNELLSLAETAFHRFCIPFTLLLPSRRGGYAVANNLALETVTTPYVCFLNSDVVSGTPGWIESLTDHLENDPELGAVGPRLLFEDGSVQHEGMVLRRIPAFDDLAFPIHSRKGLHPTGAGLRRADAITGACMMMRTCDAEALDGFDEDYLIGDFEDSDLCYRLRAKGQYCAVDLNMNLYHLERQSQAASHDRGRRNITLYNAWLHDKRWPSAAGNN